MLFYPLPVSIAFTESCNQLKCQFYLSRIFMAIQWFPGHMHKARKQIAEAMPQVDLVIEVLDARLPYSSENPLIPGLLNGKPCLKLLNKMDIADPSITEQWLKYFNGLENTKAIAISGIDKKQVKLITQYCHDMLPNRRDKKQNIRTMIMGIPNVGKSTMINTLAGRTIAKAGNLPALTRNQQHIRIDDGIVLSDTPGFLWPKIHNIASGFRLAASGAVRDTALDYYEVADFAAEMLLEMYPEQLKERFKLDELPEKGHEVIDAIGRKRGCIKSGGHVDEYKASEILIHELRSLKFGHISYETPAHMIKEEALLAETAALRELKELEKAEKKKKKKKK
ncbi:MAG: ribosome biogenesis GTPase A [Psychrobacter glaciei]|jgi:ribosome biogenesis GTPase A